VVFEPILDAALMKVVLKIARQSYNILFGLKLTQTDAALVLIGELLGVPLDIEHFLQHLCCFALLLSGSLSTLETLIQEVRDKAGEKHGA
jgi:hypothetical protein